MGLMLVSGQGTDVELGATGSCALIFLIGFTFDSPKYLQIF